MSQLQTLYRPIGIEELKLIQATGMGRFPPRLPEQPIFYPVLNREYAQQIAEQWNTKDSAGKWNRVAFVTEFDMPEAYLARFEQKVVGRQVHSEFWMPAEELEQFNNQIVGRIRVTDVFYGKDYHGVRYGLDDLNNSLLKAKH